MLKDKGGVEAENNQEGNGNNYPLVVDFNPDLPPVASYIHKHKHLLELDSELCKIIPPSKVFTSYRGNKTLKRILAPSKLYPIIQTDEDNTPPDNDLYGCFKCSKNCKMCRLFLIETKTFTSYHTDQIFKIKHTLSCESTWFIYLINDIICKKSYVGSSFDTAKSRWGNHKSHVRLNRATCGVTKHFKHDDRHNFNRKLKSMNLMLF